MSPKNTAGIWYHGSNKKFSLLREGSTITPNRALAEAFSHKPPILSCEADGTLLHNGKKYGYLYCIDEPIDEERDLYQHPRTTLEPGSEFLTARRCVCAGLPMSVSLARRSARRRNAA